MESRSIDDLKHGHFDVAIIGGGGFGAAAAWEASLRGLSVALIEQADFGSGTSANSYKMVHGGIRYLQHLDLPRLWSSCRERSAWFRIAPHLVKPLPIAMPTYGLGRSGKPLLGAGFLAYDLLTLGRNRGIKDRTRHVPWMHTMSASEVLKRFPDVPSNNLTGAAVFYDGQMEHPPRLVLAFVQSAAERGAVVANYVAADRITAEAGSVTGIVARDCLSGESFEIRARIVVNGAGPWAAKVAATASNPALVPKGPYSRDTAFVIDGLPERDYALAIEGRSYDSDALLSRAARHLFLVPWRGKTLVGVWHIVYPRGADRLRIEEHEIQRFLAEINGAYPALSIKREQIRLFNAGLVPFGESDDVGANLSFGKRSIFSDASDDGGPDGLLSVISVRHTMARRDASEALDLVDLKLGRSGKTPDSTQIPLVGGDVADLQSLKRDIVPAGISPDLADTIADAVNLYGSRTARVVALAEEIAGDRVVDKLDWLRAQVRYAVRDELGQTLADFMFRRTAIAAGGDPGPDVIEECARLMGEELGWSAARRAAEVASVNRRFPTDEFAGIISEAELTVDFAETQRDQGAVK